MPDLVAARLSAAGPVALRAVLLSLAVGAVAD
jgi:hypothetical protein